MSGCQQWRLESRDISLYEVGLCWYDDNDDDNDDDANDNDDDADDDCDKYDDHNNINAVLQFSIRSFSTRIERNLTFGCYKRLAVVGVI